LMFPFMAEKGTNLPQEERLAGSCRSKEDKERDNGARNGVYCDTNHDEVDHANSPAQARQPVTQPGGKHAGRKSGERHRRRTQEVETKDDDDGSAHASTRGDSDDGWFSQRVSEDRLHQRATDS